MIEFLCPKGHRIRCGDENAGRIAKCPKCGDKFRIPALGEGGVMPATSDSGVAEAEFSNSSKPVPGTFTMQTPEHGSQIEFLCPNGHRLHGPANLQGQPGECPECGTRFRIPMYENISAEEATSPDIGLGRADNMPDSGIDLPPMDSHALDDAHLTTGEDIPTTLGAGPLDVTMSGHSLAQLFGKFWVEKTSDTRIELQLADGERLVPNHFAFSLSQQSHGVFAVDEPNGSYSLSVIAWDSVVRVMIRGVDMLPPEMND